MMKPIIFAVLLMVTLLSACAPGQNFDARLSPVVGQYRFSIAGWEWQTLFQQAKQLLPGQQVQTDGGVSDVTQYFDAVKRIKTLQSEIAAANAKNDSGTSTRLSDELRTSQEKQTTRAATVETIIRGQIRATLAGEGIYNPVGKGKVGFPPLIFKLEVLPSVLVISPRDRIESMRELVLKQNLALPQKESIEAGVDKLGVSSLVVGVGGMGTYPSLVDGESSLQATIETAAHEWLHQYLAFTPLGFRYILDLTGVSRNYDIATMNESLAGMFGKEIGARVYEKYYLEYEDGTKQAPSSATGFDFNLEMREIRKAVDVYLARGEIEQAEAFMEQQRQALASKGYYIRKLNQAYFAFHGTYADSPAFLSPIGVELKELRTKSASLNEFLNTAAGMTSRQDLTQSLR